MRKIIMLMLALALLLAGCAGAQDAPKVETNIREPEEITAPLTETEASEAVQAVAKIYPLNDPVMENLSDSILSVSLEEGGVYVDDAGKMQMDLKIYSYDKYDMVDISMLKAGDILVTASGEVEVLALERREDGTVAVNGGLLEDGFDLVTDEDGIFYERGYNDAKNWHEVGEATIQVSVDFVCYDNSDLDAGETVYYPGDFLNGDITIYDFNPSNTTIRTENGQIVEMYRVYTP